MVIDMPPEPPPSQEQVIEQRLVGCGLDLRGVSVRYEDYLQSIEIVIGPAAGATAAHFECIRNAAGYGIVTFEDRESYQAYNDYAGELARPELLKSLEAGLRKKELFETLPRREDSENLDAYAKALEAHGGVAPGSALRVDGDDILFDPPRGEEDVVARFESYSDVIAIVTYLSVRDRFRFLFVGNEQISGE